MWRVLFDRKGEVILKVLNAINRVAETFSVVCMAIMVILNFGNVLSRYILHRSWSFTEEYIMILFLWCLMLGIVLGYSRSEHMCLTLVDEFAPTKVKIFAVIISAIASCVLLTVLMISSIDMIKIEIQYGQRTPVTGVPEPVATTAIPLCCALSIIMMIAASIKKVLVLREAEK